MKSNQIDNLIEGLQILRKYYPKDHDGEYYLVAGHDEISMNEDSLKVSPQDKKILKRLEWERNDEGYWSFYV